MYSSVLATNGKIYGIPLVTTQVIQVDPTDDSYKLIGDVYPSGGLKWAGSVLGINGKIYGVPDDFQQILEIDPTTETTRLIGNLSSDTQKWSFGFLGPDAKIYMVPDDRATTLLQYNPANDDIKLIGDLQGRDKWNGVVQANGSFYSIPDSNNNILKIDFNGTSSMDSFVQLSPYINKY